MECEIQCSASFHGYKIRQQYNNFPAENRQSNVFWFSSISLTFSFLSVFFAIPRFKCKFLFSSCPPCLPFVCGRKCLPTKDFCGFLFSITKVWSRISWKCFVGKCSHFTLLRQNSGWKKNDDYKRIAQRSRLFNNNDITDQTFFIITFSLVICRWTSMVLKSKFIERCTRTWYFTFEEICSKIILQ